MGKLIQRWRQLHPWVRRTCLFFLGSAVLLNVVLFVVAPAPEKHTTLHRTRVFLKAQNDGYDSWHPMRVAMQYTIAEPAGRLFQAIFFEQKVKFQYPPSSLLLHRALALFPYANLTGHSFMNAISWCLLWATALMVARIVILGLKQHGLIASMRLSRDDLSVMVLLAVGCTLTFYPIVQSYQLGQIQTWINAMFVATVWLWMTGRKRPAGVVLGLVCLIKPQLTLVLLWAAIRRQWGFAGAMLATGLAGGMASVAMFGLQNHLDYLAVLSFISRHGESYFPNHSVNGLLHRLLFNGSNLQWHDNAFAPYHPVVYWGTLASSLALIGLALLWRRGENRHAGALDLCVAGVTFTMASPVAWEHHYGLTIAAFAVLLPALWALPTARKLLPLAAGSYAVCSNLLGWTDFTADTLLNPLQSYLFFGAVALLYTLYRTRHALHAAAARPSTAEPGAAVGQTASPRQEPLAA